MIDDSVNRKKTAPEEEIIDVNLGYVEKRKFRINGDSNRIVELNVSDLNIFSRLHEAYPKLQASFNKSVKVVDEMKPEEDDIEQLAKISEMLTTIDKEMRAQIDYIFDTNASEVCAPKGNMYDPVGGQLRFEHIIDTLSTLYTNGLNAEFAKMKKTVEKKATKYTKKYHK